MTLTVQVAQRGVVSLTKALRDNYNIRRGDVYTVIDPAHLWLLEQHAEFTPDQQGSRR